MPRSTFSFSLSLFVYPSSTYLTAPSTPDIGRTDMLKEIKETELLLFEIDEKKGSIEREISILHGNMLFSLFCKKKLK